jgi:uncharacterized protein with HEPN domain
MSPEERDRAYLWDMLEAARQAVDFTRGLTFDAYVADPMRRMAVERSLELLGEAARRVTAGFREGHPEIPWRDLIGLGNVLAHDYGEVEQDRLWQIATRDAATLTDQLESLVPGAPDR